VLRPSLHGMADLLVDDCTDCCLDDGGPDDCGYPPYRHDRRPRAGRAQPSGFAGSHQSIEPAGYYELGTNAHARVRARRIEDNTKMLNAHVDVTSGINRRLAHLRRADRDLIVQPGRQSVARPSVGRAGTLASSRAATAASSL
jgi:hypothetical protein